MNPWSKIYSDYTNKLFYWKYDHYEGILLKIPRENNEWELTKYSISQVEKTLNYIFKNEIVEVNNNITKLEDGFEKSGLGTFFYDSFSDKVQINNILHLVEILLDLEILNSNKDKDNLKVWLKNIDWKSRIEKKIDFANVFPILKLEINHITFEVSDLDKSVDFYEKLFDKSVIALGDKMAYFDLDGIWFALNEKLTKKKDSYDHIAFSVQESQLINLKLYYDNNGIEYHNGRERFSEEGSSIYINDPDKHLIEFHTKSLNDRLDFYSKGNKIKIFK
ncbi:MAG: VOC family protein [Firmicutes bacterium]|jgi:metallothiol transferase|nr:VOC family protein [Bacillota bacterium]